MAGGPTAQGRPFSVCLCTGGYDQLIRFWEASTGTCSQKLQHSESQINCLEITPDQRLLAVAGNPNIQMFELETGSVGQLRSFEGHSASVTAVQFERDARKMFTASEDGSVKFWDIRAPKKQKEYTNSKIAINSAVLHPTDAALVIGDQSGAVRVWDLTADAVIHEFIPEVQVPIRSVCVSNDARTLTAANNAGNIYVWKLQGTPHGGGDSTAQEATAMTMADMDDDADAEKPTRAASTAPAAGKAVQPTTAGGDSSSSGASGTAGPGVLDAAASDHLDYLAYEQVAKIDAHNGYCLKALLSPDGEMLATASSDHTIRLWEMTTFGKMRELVGHRRWVWDIAFSIDSQYLVSASSDATVKLWALNTGDPVLEYIGHTKAVTALALNDVAQQS